MWHVIVMIVVVCDGFVIDINRVWVLITVYVVRGDTLHCPIRNYNESMGMEYTRAWCAYFAMKQAPLSFFFDFCHLSFGSSGVFCLLSLSVSSVFVCAVVLWCGA